MAWWEELERVKQETKKEQTLPSQVGAAGEWWAPLAASRQVDLSESSKPKAWETAANTRSIMTKDYSPTLSGSAQISAPEQKTGVKGLRFNSPSTGLPLISVNDPQVEVTEDSPWYVKAAAGAANVFTGTMSNIVNRFGDLFDVLGQERLPENVGEVGKTEEIKPVDRAAAMIDVAAAGLSVPFATISAELTAAEELPIVGKPIFGTVNKGFELLDSAARFGGRKIIDALPVSMETKQVLYEPVQNLAGIVGTLGLIKGIHYVGKTGGAGVVERLPVSEKVKESIKGGTSVASALSMAPFSTAYRSIVGGISRGVNREVKLNGEVTPNAAKRIVNQVVKKTEIPEDTGTMRVPTSGGEILLRTNQKSVLQNLIRGREDLTYKVVETLGKDLEGQTIASKFTWDFKKQEGIIEVTDKATAVNLAHELGHYVDRRLGSSLSARLSDLLPNYRENRESVNQMLADYALERLEGNATKEQIDTEIMRIAGELTREIELVAANEARSASNEKFASAFAGIIDKPKTRELAPELSRLVEFSVGRDVMRQEKAGDITGEPGSVQERGSILSTLEKTRKGIVKETVKSDQGFYEKQQADQAARESIEARESRLQNYDYKRILKAIRNSGEFKKEGRIAEAEGFIMTLNGREIWVPDSRVTEFLKKGYTKVASMDEIAHADGFERAADYVDFITELNADTRAINRSPIQKQAHEYLIETDQNYANLTRTIDKLRDDIIAEENATRTAQPAGAEGEGRVPGERQEIAGTGLDTGKRVEDRKSYNPEKINAPEDVETLLKEVAEVSGEFAEQRISKSNEDVRNLANEVGVKPEDLIRVQAGSIANAETVFKSRQLIADMAQDLRDFVRTIGKDATKEQLQASKEKLLRLQGVMKTVAGFRTEASNVFRQFQMEARAGENDVLRDLVSELKKVDAEAGADLSMFVKGTRELMEPTVLDKAWHVWYASVLSGPSTQAKNVLGNTSNLIAELGRVAVSKPAELPGALRGLREGLGKGVGEAKRMLKEQQVSKFEKRGLKPIKFEGKASFLNYLDYVGRFMNATDAFFKEGFRGMELRSLAREQAMLEGVKGKELESRINELVERPMEEMVEQANKFAERGTYTNKPHGIMGWLSNSIESGLRVREADSLAVKVGKTTGKLIVPFTRIVANVVNTGLDWTPAGLSKGIRLPREGESLRERNQRMARAVLGTMAMSVFATMAADGNLSGHGPNDKKRREQLQAAGWKQNSVKIGDKWYPYTNWGPFAIPMTIVGNLFDGFKYGGINDDDEFATIAGYTIANTVNSIMDISFLRGLGDFVGAIMKPEENQGFIQRFVAQTLTSPYPNLLKQLDRFGDPTQYEADTLKEQILYNLRITSSLQPRLNVWGDVIEGDRLTGIEPEQISQDPVYSYMTENNLFISIPSKTTQIQVSPKEKRPMTEDEYYRYVQESGPEIKRRIEQRLAYIKNLRDDEARQDYIEEIVDDVREAVKQEIGRDAN